MTCAKSAAAAELAERQEQVMIAREVLEERQHQEYARERQLREQRRGLEMGL